MDDLFDFVGMFTRKSEPLKGKTIDLMKGGDKMMADPTMMMNNFIDFAIDLFTFTGNSEEDIAQYIEKIMAVEQSEPEYWEVLCRWADELRKHEGVYDFFGGIYESDVISGFKASNLGQFFTPFEVGKAVARMSFVGQDFSESPSVLVYDPCCGSSRLLLTGFQEAIINDTANNKPIILVGGDIDMMSVKMSSLNAMMCGAYALYKCQDTLTLEPPVAACVVNSTNYPRKSGIYSLQWMTEDINRYADYYDENGVMHKNEGDWLDKQVYTFYHFDELIKQL